MTPTTGQRVALLDAALVVYAAAVAGDMGGLWTAYFALGKTLRQTGTEPPQPADVA